MYTHEVSPSDKPCRLPKVVTQENEKQLSQSSRQKQLVSMDRFDVTSSFPGTKLSRGKLETSFPLRLPKNSCEGFLIRYSEL
jgi:hypothetical protein